MLNVESLSYQISKTAILKNISLATRPGELWVVLGPNGAGKSSLLSILAGEHFNFSGQVLLVSKPLQDYRAQELAQVRAMMPQSVTLDFGFQVKEVVEMGLLSSFIGEGSELIQRALDLFEVSDLSNRNYLTLSGGEQQRVQLARIAAQLLSSPRIQKKQPQILLLDECTSSLDVAHQQQVFKVLTVLIKQYRLCVIAVLHDLNLASQFADKALLLHQGEVYASGDIQQVLTQQNIEEVYQTPVTIIERHQAWSVIVPQ